MAAEGQPQHILNSLCTALAICSMHMKEGWSDFVDTLIHEFSDSVDHAICLLMIIKYMASDCDNDSIVIEDSMRREFFQFLDDISPQVFEQVFNAWAANLLAGGKGIFVRGKQTLT